MGKGVVRTDEHFASAERECSDIQTGGSEVASFNGQNTPDRSADGISAKK